MTSRFEKFSERARKGPFPRAGRGPALQPQLYLHRAHPLGPRSRVRGRCRKGIVQFSAWNWRKCVHLSNSSLGAETVRPPARSASPRAPRRSSSLPSTRRAGSTTTTSATEHPPHRTHARGGRRRGKRPRNPRHQPRQSEGRDHQDIEPDCPALPGRHGRTLYLSHPHARPARNRPYRRSPRRQARPHRRQGKGNPARNANPQQAHQEQSRPRR